MQAIIDANCISCHTGNGTTLPGSMDLTPITNQINVASQECPEKLRIQSGHPETSYLVDKILGMSQAAGGCFMGGRMPLNATPLTAQQIATITGWIGSLN